MTKTRAGKKQQSKCDNEVKKIFINYSHTKCTCANRRMYATKVTGATLNKYLHNHRHSDSDPNHFNAQKHYNICSNLKGMLDRSTSITSTPQQ